MTPTHRAPTRPYVMLLKEFGEVLQGKLQNMTPETAKALSVLTDTSDGMWLNLAKGYEDWIASRTQEQQEEAQFQIGDADARLRDLIESMEDVMLERREALRAAYQKPRS